MVKNLNKRIKSEWDTHWKKVNKNTSIFGKLLEFHRYYIIAYSVKYYFEKYFPTKGVFVEMGSGTSQTSLRIIKHKRTLIALDISKEALNEAKKIPLIDKTIQADIFHTGLKDNSINGIWNLGVMEHFTQSDIIKMLNEFYRVIKPGSHVILFWPPEFGSSEIALAHIAEPIINVFRKDKFHFFPGEITRVQSMKHVRNIISKSKLSFVNAHFNFRDAFTHVVVVCKK